MSLAGGIRVLGADEFTAFATALPRYVVEEMKPGIKRAQLLVQTAVRRHASGVSVGAGSDIAPSRGKLAQSWQVGAIEVRGLTDVRGPVGSNLAYAAIHEFGGTIRPRSARALTIPVSPLAARKRARDFQGAFILQTRDGAAYIARRAGGARSARIELLFLLKKQVTLRARHYVSNALKDVDPQLEPVLGQAIGAAIARKS